VLRRSLIGVLLLALVTLLWRCADAPPEPVAPSDAPSDGVAAVMSAAISAPERAREGALAVPTRQLQPQRLVRRQSNPRQRRSHQRPTTRVPPIWVRCSAHAIRRCFGSV
jgi:hypothetical protein